MARRRAAVKDRLSAHFGKEAKRIAEELGKKLGLEKIAKYNEDQPRDDHGRWGEGGGDKGKGPVVYHGTTKAYADKILKEGLKTRSGDAVYTTTDKEMAIGYGASSTAALYDTKGIVDKLDNAKIALVVVSDPKAAGFTQKGDYWTSPKDIGAKYIDRVEIYGYKAWNDASIDPNNFKALVPERIIRGGTSKSKVVEVYLPTIFESE